MAKTVGIVGAGRLGNTLARLSLKAGYDVLIANSRGPETLGLQLKVLLPGAQAADVQEISDNADIVILAIPLRHYKNLSPTLFAGKVVIDAMNYWAPVEGHVEEFAADGFSSSAFIQHYFTSARIVKTLNHVAYNELDADSKPSAPFNERRAILMAGDDENAKRDVADFVNAIGFDPVDLGSITEGALFAPDTPAFNARFARTDISAILNA